MSYAIIRNEKYTKDEMIKLAPHNERFKKKYSNKNIDLSKTSQNYHLKRPQENSYLKEYQRLIKENNLNISGGEAQKLALYKLYLDDKAICILDEPTAALDLNSEGKMIEFSKHNFYGKTLFIITHKPQILEILLL